MDLRRVLIGVVVVVAVGFGALALFGSKSLDTDDLESDLAGQVAPRVNAQEGTVEVSCPEDVDVEAGTTFECDVAHGESGTVTVEVELTDDDGRYVARLVR